MSLCDWTKDLDELNAEMELEAATSAAAKENQTDTKVGTGEATSQQTLQSGSTSSLSAPTTTTTKPKELSTSSASTDEDPFSSLSLDSLVLSSKSGPSDTTDETAATTSKFENDPIIAKMLEQRGPMTDVSEKDEAERRKRMYIMLRWSNHYKKLQVEKANEHWKAETGAEEQSGYPNMDHTKHAEIVNGLESLLNSGSDHEGSGSEHQQVDHQSLGRSSRSLSPTSTTRTASPAPVARIPPEEVEGPPIIDVDLQQQQLQQPQQLQQGHEHFHEPSASGSTASGGFLATPPRVSSQRRASSASSYADAMPNRNSNGRIHGRRVSFSSRVTHIAVEGIPFNPAAHLAAITSSCNLEKEEGGGGSGTTDATSGGESTTTTAMDPKNGQRLDSGKHIGNGNNVNGINNVTSISRLVEKTASDRPVRPLRINMMAQSTLPGMETQQSTFQPQIPFSNAERDPNSTYDIPAVGNSVNFGGQLPGTGYGTSNESDDEEDNYQPIITVIPDPTPPKPIMKKSIFTIFRRLFKPRIDSKPKPKPKRPSTRRSSISPTTTLERTSSSNSNSKRRKSIPQVVSNVIASLAPTSSPTTIPTSPIIVSTSSQIEQGFESPPSSTSSNDHNDENDDDDDYDDDLDASPAFIPTIPRKSICSSTSESTTLGENNRQVVVPGGSSNGNGGNPVGVNGTSNSNGNGGVGVVHGPGLAEIRAYLESPQASKRGSADTVAILAGNDGHGNNLSSGYLSLLKYGERYGDKAKGRRGSLYETTDRTPAPPLLLPAGRVGVDNNGFGKVNLNGNLNGGGEIQMEPAVREKEGRGKVGGKLKGVSAVFSGVFGRNFIKKKRRGSRQNVMIVV
ncbi:hypothetical protein HDU76_001923 [Blyttiomyces sp. JEL0837]|nr:hypothetical protein HDU76_001923 [Blyttiomyces sp. JEL0837]